MLPPTIPTSFVPHTSTAPRRGASDPSGIFSYFCYGVLVVAFILAVGVFSYGQVLIKTRDSKDKQLADAINNIDSSTVDGFVRLRDRLDASNDLLNSHVAFTGFFSALEKVQPSSVRFSSLRLSVSDSGEYSLNGKGVAKSFNALAAASTAFVSDGNIKSAIFSGISINKDSTVAFSLSAVLDPKLVSFDVTANEALDAPQQTP